MECISNFDEDIPGKKELSLRSWKPILRSSKSQTSFEELSNFNLRINVLHLPHYPWILHVLKNKLFALGPEPELAVMESGFIVNYMQ